jgi:hypothetical protein
VNCIKTDLIFKSYINSHPRLKWWHYYNVTCECKICIIYSLVYHLSHFIYQGLNIHPPPLDVVDQIHWKTSSDSARHRSQKKCPPISQIVLKNFINISLIIKECHEEYLIKLSIVLKISKSSWNTEHKCFIFTFLVRFCLDK